MVNQKEHFNIQQTVSATASQFQVDRGQCKQHVFEGFQSSLNNSVAAEVPKPVEDRKEWELNIDSEKEKKEMGSLPSVLTSSPMGYHHMTEDKEMKEREVCFQKVSEPIDLSSDEDMISAVLNVSEYGGEGSSLLYSLLDAKHDVQHEDKQLEKTICTSNAMNSSNHIIADGEISGDFRIDNKSFDQFLEDASPLEENKAEEVHNPKNVTEKTVFPWKVQNGEKEEDSESTAFVANTLHNMNNGGEVEPSGSDANGLSCKAEVAISGKHSTPEKACGISTILQPGTSKSKDSGDKEVVELPATLPCKVVQFLEDKVTGNCGIMSTVKQEAVVSRKKKRGPPSEEKKARKKKKERKKQAEKNRRLGVKRLKLQPALKPKIVTYCRHYLKGRCQEMPAKEDLPAASNVCTPEQKPSASSGSTNFNKHLKINGIYPLQHNVFSDLVGIRLSENTRHDVADTVVKQPKLAPKGVSFFNVAKSALVNSSELNQGISTPRRSDGLQNGNQTDQSASGAAQISGDSNENAACGTKGN
ncbi:zinc finger CCCH domain-containing protein 65 [Quillaja saponaria]|uniref:Zinc finger CCCH domain-containing protein 65 n=1 Tax=Quillaja saponaria TaxID=32244 RepID=A0AAD7LD36_QUISA|nr:zinc finger CCCH domain-containing protein 65 [Quillaja saponaria]